MAWIVAVAGGYALVYYAGMDGGTFLFTDERLEPSWVSSATLGLGDVTPLSSFYQIVAVSEALIGFGIYLLSVVMQSSVDGDGDERRGAVLR